MDNDEVQSTDPKLPVVDHPDQKVDMEPPLVDLSKSPQEPTVTVSTYHPETDIASFAGKVQGLVAHADAQSQVESEFKSRWEWWMNKLSEFYHEVRSHV